MKYFLLFWVTDKVLTVKRAADLSRGYGEHKSLGSHM